MAATITVFIQGLAICYQKQIGTKKVWKIFFRADPPCHRVEFSTQQTPGGRRIVHENFGRPNGKFEIVTFPDTAADSSTDSTERFKNEVFNLTQQGKTHTKIATKPGGGPAGTLVTIENMKLDVDKNIMIAPAEDEALELVLTHRGNRVEVINHPIAYSLTGTIRLKDGGIIKVNEIMPNGARREIFRTTADQSHRLFLDNDCERTRREPGDMHKLYDIVKDKNSPDPLEQFLVESRRVGSLKASKGEEYSEEKSSAKESSEEDNAEIRDSKTGQFLTFHGDKPCLIAQATDDDGLE
jgi:hypothetical protein